jgi:hypothetical protein
MAAHARRAQVYVYHGHNRSRDVAFLGSHDVIITTYETCAAEYAGTKESQLAAEKREARAVC